jgi:PKD domain
MKFTIPVVVAALVLAVGGHAAGPTTVQPGQSWSAACSAAAPGDTVYLAAGSHPSQSITCDKSAPGVTFQPAPGAEGAVVVGSAGASENCMSLTGSWITVVGVRTPMYGSDRQCGVAIGRGDAHHITLRNVDAGHFWIAANDVNIVGGDYGPTLDKVSKISERTCSATDFSCMPTRVTIDGAYIHDHRRGTQHMECIAWYGGVDATLRNSRLHNCSVFHVFVSGPSSANFRNTVIENNVFSCGDQAVSNAVKFSNHGARFTGSVVRGNRFECQETFVASSSASDVRYEGNTGGGLHMNNGGPKPPGSYSQGSTVVTVSGSVAPPPPPPSGNAAPTPCFTRTPSDARAGQAVTFSAACSKDPDGDSLTFTWDISPGGDGIYERSGATVTYAYGSRGTKTARLKVDDGHGHVVTTSQTFAVTS